MLEKQVFEYNGAKVEIGTDYNEIDNNPREWDNLGHMICFHNHYNLGDENLSSHKFECLDDIIKYITDNNKVCLIRPLYLYDHSGLTISLKPFNDIWDSCQIGFMYITEESIVKMGITDKSEEALLSYLETEIELYNHYLNCDVWSYIIKRGNRILDSCSGIYLLNDSDMDNLIVEIKSIIDSDSNQLNLFTSDILIWNGISDICICDGISKQ